MYPKEFIKLIYASLPEEISNAIASEETLDNLFEIEDRYSLSQTQRGNLLLETTMRLVGLTPRDKFKENIEKKLSIAPEISNKILENIKTAILSKIPEEIQDTQEKSAQEKLKNLKPEIKTVENISPLKSTALEIPPQMSIVPEGKVMDHLPPISPTVPKVQAPVVESPKIESPKVEIPVALILPSYTGKDPYREPLE